MSQYIKNTDPASRAAGCIFAEKFESNSAVQKNGGTLNGDAYCEDGFVVLDGTGDHVEYEDQDKLSFGNGVTDSPFSISCWVHMEDATDFPIISKGVYNTDGEYKVEIDSDDKIVFNLFDESVADCYIGRSYDTAITSYEDKGVHVVVTYDGSAASSGCSIYINGSAVDDTNSENDAGNYVAMENLGGELRIGRYDSDYANGQIKDVKIWDRELTALEVEAMYNRTMNKYEDNLVLDLKMDMANHDPTGEAVGENLLTDGDMEAADTSAWPDQPHGTNTKEDGARDGSSGSKVLRITTSGGTSGAKQASILTVGKTYRITGWARGDGDTGNPRLYDIGENFYWNGTVSTDWQYFDETYTAGGAHIYLYCYANNGYVEYDDVTVRLVQPCTKDSSPNKAHAILGSGDGGATTPSKLDWARGYDFDGSDDYMVGTATGLFNSNEISIVCEFYPDFLPSDDVNCFFVDARVSTYDYRIYKRNNGKNNVLYLHLGDTKYYQIPEATYSPYWYKGRKNVIILTGDFTNNLMNCWVNDGHVVTDEALTGDPSNPSNYYIGSSDSLSYYFDGKITKFQVYNTVLNEQQVKDILIRSNIELNRTI